MYEKLLSIVRKLPFLSGDSSSAQLLRTYIVGGFNLVFGLSLNYIFQFLILSSVEVPLRTYLTNIFSFAIGVVVFSVMFYSMWAHTKKKNPEPAKFHENHKLEIAWTIIPFLILSASYA